MDPLDNTGAPVIPAGTKQTGGVAYDPLRASQNQGQAQPAPKDPNVAVSNAPAGTTFGELAAKKGWKTPDDMAKSYSELESHNKKVEMTAADVLRMVQEAQPAPAPQVAPQPAQVAPSEDQAIKIVQNIARAEVAPLKEQIALQQLFLDNPDAKTYAEGIAKSVKENPGISWSAAYKLAKFDSLQQQAVESQKQQSANVNHLKQQMIAGNAAPTNRGGPDVRSIIKDRSVPFKEVDKIVREYLTAQQ